MDFSRPKLPLSEAPNLRRLRLKSLKPYELVVAPIYAYLRKNEKFIAIRAPLDFFTPNDLEKLKAFDLLYTIPFVDIVSPFKTYARMVRRAIEYELPHAVDPRGESLGEGYYPVVPLDIANYEKSDAILRPLGSVWGPGTTVEPFFVAIFIEELLGTIDGDLMESVRDAGVERFEVALMRSAWTIFLALHIGYVNLTYLKALHARCFKYFGLAKGNFEEDFLPEEQELIVLASESLETNKVANLSSRFVMDRFERAAQKLKSRFQRMAKEFINERSPMVSIFGKNGFRDV